jgi:hypothetical protein
VRELQMNRSEDNTCEYCKADLPREAIGNVHFCSVECFDASELEAAGKRFEERMHAAALLFPAPRGLLGQLK